MDAIKSSTDTKINEKPISLLLVTCSLCKNIYQEPKILCCFHTFCEKCLHENTPPSSLTHHCHICGNQSILPEGGTSVLKKNHYIQRLLDKIQCSKPSHSKPTMSDYGSDLHSNLAEEVSPGFGHDENDTTFRNVDELIKCHNHSSRIGVSYCKGCHLVVCRQCAEDEHAEHPDCVDSMQAISEECERLLLEQVTALEAETKELKNLLQKITSVSGQLKNNTRTAKQNINQMFDNLEKIICERRGQLLREVDRVYLSKYLPLEKQSMYIKKCIDNLEEGINLVTDFTSCANEQNLSSSKNATILNPKTKKEEHLHNCQNEANVENTTEDDRSRLISQQTFLLHKQISTHLDDLNNNTFHDISKYKLVNDMLQSLSSNPNNLKINPEEHFCMNVCENPHVKFKECQESKRVAQLLSNIGSVGSSHAVADTSSISGECLTTGECYVDQENVLILTAKTSLGEIEKSGDVPISVNFQLVCPDKTCHMHKPFTKMKTNQERSLSLSNKATIRTSSLSSSSRPRSRKPRPDSQVVITPRTPLKDIFFPASPNVKTHKSPKQKFVNGSLPEYQITHINDGSYEISICPKECGEYELSISVCDEALTKCPFKIQAMHYEASVTSLSTKSLNTYRNTRNRGVRQRGMKHISSSKSKKTTIDGDLLLRIGEQGRSVGEFTNPQGVSVDPHGRLLVADSTNQSVQVFAIKGETEQNMKSKYIFKFGEKGRGMGQIMRPTGVFGLQDGKIAVADYDNKVVIIFNSNGSYHSKIGSGKLLGPKGVCVDNNGHLIVVDNKLCEVFVFQMNGKLVTRFGSRGTDERHLAGPHYVVVNKENNLFISDFYNHCVKVFTTTGKYLGSIGTSGEGCGQFNAPTGLAIDYNGNLIVSDWGNSRIQIFDKEGSFLSYVNTSDDPLYGPQDISVIKHGQIAVADAGNHCVKIYKYLQ